MQPELATLFDGASQRNVAAGGFLFHAGDRVARMHLVEAGSVSLERGQPDGMVTCFQRAGPSEILAEASAYSSQYHCDARALEDTRLRCLPRADFLRRLDESPERARAWAAHLARSVQRTRLIAEIRSFKTVAERLNAWLDAFGGLPPRGRWQAVAHDLAISREALYREMARRRARGDQL